MFQEISLIQAIPPLVALATFISSWAMWKSGKNQVVVDSIYKRIGETEQDFSSSVKSLADKVSTLDTKIDTKSSHLEIIVNQFKESATKETQEVKGMVHEHKRDSITEIRTRQLIDDKVEPVWEVLRDLKGSMQQLTSSQNEILKALSRVEGAMDYKKRRSTD